MLKTKYKTGTEPSPTKGVEDCLVCNFSVKDPLGINKRRPADFALIDRACKNETSDRQTVTAMWNSCCGSFNRYEVILIKDIYGKPYAGQELKSTKEKEAASA